MKDFVNPHYRTDFVNPDRVHGEHLTGWFMNRPLVDINELKDLPGVGPLFGSQQKQKKSTELLILITPYVILSEQEAIQVGTDQLLKHPGAATAGALDHIEMEFDL